MIYKRQHFKKGQRLTAESMNQVDKWLAHICGKEIVAGEVNAKGELELTCKDGETICLGTVGSVNPEEVTTLIEAIIAEAKANGEFGGKISVKTYGAKGDGKTDDTAAFKSALAENRIVFVPGGTYKLTSGITIGDNCCLELAQDAVLNFTNTTGNCITLGMLSNLKGNHATIKVPYEFSGNVLYAYSNTHTNDDIYGVPPFAERWDPQWKSGRYVTDVNICKADSRGFHYAVEPEDCKGTAVYISADNTKGFLTFMWGVHYSGLRIAGAFAYGILCKNIDNGWLNDMRIDALIDACEIGVQLEDCGQVYVSATIQPRRAYSIDEVYAPYAKHGIKLVNSKNVDLSGSRVWDWENEDKTNTTENEKMTLWSDGGEYQSYAMIGNCTGAILNDLSYHSKGDTRKRIYTDSDVNLDTMTIIQEPIDRYFKVINDEPYYSDGVFEHKLITQEHLDKHFDTGIIKNFTDVLATAIDTDGSIYNGIGYKKNTRLELDGSTKDSGYYVTTGFIPCVAGSEIYTHDMSFSKGDDNCRVIFYDKDFNVVRYGENNSATAHVNRGLLLKNGNTYVAEYTELADGFKLTVNGGQYGPHKNTAYVRFVIYKTVWGENPMVAVDEQIAYTVEGFLADGIKVKGENVIGVVKSVNGKTPDASGNITVETGGDSGGATAEQIAQIEKNKTDIEQLFKQKADETAIPVKTSQLTNDSDYVTSDVTTAISAQLASETAARTVAIDTERSERQTEIAVERARINSLTQLAEGSTTGDAELQDIRVGYDGTVYDTAGESVREQVAAAMSKKSGCLGILFNASACVAIDTTAKTFTIPKTTRVIYGDKVYIATLQQPLVIDISNPANGYITYDTESNTFETNAHTDLAIEQTKIVIATYGNSGATVNMPGSFSIDGNMFGVDTGNLSEGSVNTAAIKNEAVTMAKRTVAGSFAVLWNYSKIPEFNTTEKTFTVPRYSRILLGTKTYTAGMTGSTDIVLDLSNAQHGYICYDTVSGAFTVYPYTQTTGVPESSVLFASYAEYGKFVHMACSYKIDGNLFGIETSGNGIADKSIAGSKLVDGAVTTVKSTVAGRSAYLWDATDLPNFDTVNKTFTIPFQSRVMSGKGVYADVGTLQSAITLDLSAVQQGYITFNPVVKEWRVYPYSTISITENEIIMFAYSNYGEIVSSQSAFSVNGIPYGIKAAIENGAITKDKLADGAVTFAKRTPAGCIGVIWSRYGVPEFDTNSKTLVLPKYCEITLGAIRYTNATGGQPQSIDLTDFQSGTIVFNTATKEFSIYAYNNYAARPENLVAIAAYVDYGEMVFMPGAYKINGNLYGIDTPNIPDGYITQDMLAPKLLQNQLSRCPRYTFTDLSAIGITAWSDISIIGDNLWMFYPSTDEEHTNSNGTIKIVNKETLEVVKTITHNFGHVNTCDYCKETDCLIVGNLPGNTAYPAALYIFYNVSDWANVDTLDFATVDKTIVDMRGAFPTATNAACSWGESNFAYNNIVYVSFGYDKQFTKIVLGMGTNQLTNGTYAAADADKFNGTYNILLTSDFAPMGSGDEVIQGATFYKGQMLTANGDEWTARASLWQFDINGNIQRELLEFPIYNADGQKNSQYKTYTEGITVDEETGYIYQGIFSGQLYAIRFYLIKYKL